MIIDDYRIPEDVTIQNYSEMRRSMEALSEQYNGKSLTLGEVDHGSKTLDMYASLFLPHGPPKGVFALVGGHHQLEEGGSESAYHIACALLSCDYNRQKDIALLVVPQVNVHWYESKTLEHYRSTGEVPNIPEDLRCVSPFLSHYSSDYLEQRNKDMHTTKNTRLLREIEKIKSLISAIESDVAPIRMSFDFHESPPIFEGYLLEEDKILEERGFRFLYMEPVSEAMDQVEAAGYQVHPNHDVRIPRFKTLDKWHRYLESLDDSTLELESLRTPIDFSKYLRLRNANSFVAETVVDQPLKDRIYMNMIAVDWVLSHRHMD